MKLPEKPKNKGVLSPWNRSRTLFPRDYNGNLMPKAVPILGSVDEEMVMIPLTISDIDRIRLKLSMGELSTSELSEHMINKCMVYPLAKDFELMKPDYKDRIKLTVLFESGFDIYDEKKKTKQSKLSDKRKLYEMFAQDESYVMQTVLLQELGSYNFFNIPKLTKHEIKLLLQSKSKIIKKRRESTNG